MTPDQVREARILLGWSRQRLAAHCEMGGEVIAAYEMTGRIVEAASKQRSSVNRLSAFAPPLSWLG